MPIRFQSRLILNCVVLVLIAGCSRGAPTTESPLTPEEGAAREASLRDAMTKRPNDPQIPFELADLLASEGQAEEASAMLQQTLELDPSRADAVEDLRDRYLGVYQARARSRVEDGAMDEALVQLDAADAMRPDTAETLLMRGQVAKSKKDSPAAADYFRRSLEQQPSKIARTGLCDALISQGRKAYEAGSYAQAWELLTEAQSVESRPDLYLFLGTVSYSWAQTLPADQRGEHLEQARVAFTQALEANSDDEDARFNLATCLLAMGRYDEAAQIYQGMVERDRENGNFYMALARAHSLAGQSALATTEEAIGRALTVGEAVLDPPSWAERSAERFARSDLARSYAEAMAPQAIRTYSLPGGGLVEVWFYWDRGVVEAFRDGARLGPPFRLQSR